VPRERAHEGSRDVLGKEFTADELDLVLAFLNALSDKTRHAKAK